MRINEIFYSIQGEGRYMGVPVVFVRVQGCSLHCPWCFGPDSNGRYPYVLYADGSYKPLDEVQNGDVLYTEDLNTGELVTTTVQRVTSHTTDKWLKVQIGSFGSGHGSNLYVTPEHPFYKDGKWVRADELKPGDYVRQVPDWKVHLAGMMDDNALKALREYTHQVMAEYMELEKGLGSNRGERNGRYDASRTDHNFQRLKWMLHRGWLRDVLTDSSSVLIHHIDGNHDNDDLDNLVVISSQLHNRIHTRGNNFGKGYSPDNTLMKVYNVVPNYGDGAPRVYLGKTKDVINLETDKHSFIVNGYLVHNCDSSNTWETSVQQPDWSPERILQDVRKVAPQTCKTIVVTGGEPTEQEDLYQFVQEAIYAGYRCHLETNGTDNEIIRGYFDWVVCSPKPGANYHISKGVDELKYVIGAGDNINKIIPAGVRDQFKGRIWLQPKADGNKVVPENVQYCLQQVLKDPRLRMGYQFHKLVGVR